MRSRLSDRSAWGFVFGLIVASSPLLAANLVVNPAFTGGIAPWAAVGGGSQADADTADAAGATTSGSLKVTDTLGPAAIAAAFQCVAVSANTHYRFHADVLFPNGQPDGKVVAFFVKYASSNCTGNALDAGGGTFITNFVAPRPDWQRIGNANVVFGNANTHSVALYVGVEHNDASSGDIVARFDNVVFEPGLGTGPCSPDGSQLCLDDFRFQVTVSWVTSQDHGDARAQQTTADSGAFTFFAPDNVEMQIKVLNACGLNQRYWVYASGTTDVGVTMTVFDTKKSKTKVYNNVIGHPFTPILDSSAFATCP